MLKTLNRVHATKITLLNENRKENTVEIDEKYMKRCIQLAQCGEFGAAPNPMVGAVIVHKDRIIGEGFHRRRGGPHAEVNAVRSVKNPELLRDSTIYCSLEPCSHYGKTPPCADLIIEKGIPRVVVGCQDPFAKVDGQGIRKMREAGIEVAVGVLEQECLELNKRFITYQTKKRPWIQLKWAQSADGFLARADGTPVQFSTPLTQVLVHRLRAYTKAIMVGTNTVLTDNPTLTTRLWDGPNPLRATIDSKGILPAGLHLRDGQAETVIYQTGDLREILHDLYLREKQTLMVEGGARLLQSFLDEGLWDELRIETSPMLLGQGIPAPKFANAKCTDEVEMDGNHITTWVNFT